MARSEGGGLKIVEDAAGRDLDAIELDEVISTAVLAATDAVAQFIINGEGVLG